MFPFKSCLRRLFLFPPIWLGWEFACAPVACTRLKELPSWTCSRGEWRSADVVSYMFDVTQQRALSLEELSLRNSNTSTVTNLECLVSFRLYWLSLPSLSLSVCAHASQKNFQEEEVRGRDCRSWYPSEDKRSSEWQPAQDCIPRHYFLCEHTWITLLNVCQSMITNLKKWQRHSRQQLIMSAFIAALEKSLDRSSDDWLATRHANPCGFHRRLNAGNPPGGRQSARNQLF